MSRSPLTNADVADLLEQAADLLETQHANPFRVRAYREAARVVRTLPREVAEIVEAEGGEALVALPAIGRSLAASLEELCHTGRLPVLERLLGQVSPEDLFSTVPGVGEALAHRVHDELHVETLEELELAAHDGRLERVRGFGPRRVAMLRAALGERLRRSTRRRARLIRQREEAAGGTVENTPLPDVRLLLRLDARYRRAASKGALRTIAPRRFNPEGRSWLPIMHEDVGPWRFTLLFSNTARAHELGRTRDWVVVYFERDGHEGQCTVVTETHGPLTGERVVRGRERECARRLSPARGARAAPKPARSA